MGQGLALFAVLVAVSGNIAVFGTGRVATDHASDVAHRAATATQALCIQRTDLDHRIRTTAELLRETAGDPTVFGVPRIVLVEQQRENVILRRSLRILKC